MEFQLGIYFGGVICAGICVCIYIALEHFREYKRQTEKSLALLQEGQKELEDKFGCIRDDMYRQLRQEKQEREKSICQLEKRLPGPAAASGKGMPALEEQEEGK